MLRAVLAAVLLAATMIVVIHAHARVGRIARERDVQARRVRELTEQLAQTRATMDEAARRTEFEGVWQHAWQLGGERAFKQPSHVGTVLSSDNLDNVHVVSFGKQDGVEAGFLYLVNRGGLYVATIQIVDVQARQSAGRAVKGLARGPILEGDVVRSFTPGQATER